MMSQSQRESDWSFYDDLGPPLHLFQYVNQQGMFMEEEDFVSTFYQQTIGVHPQMCTHGETLVSPTTLHLEFCEEFRGV